jgi:prepilin-type N-terminal cleavage/methylation domain-containing protein
MLNINSKKQAGFTIVELLIVIVVIGILAALVLNTFQGVQARARDTERRTDINAIATQLEVYYNDFGYYPDNSATTGCGEAGGESCVLSAILPDRGLDAEALNDPSGDGVGEGDYTYTPECATAPQCESFTLTADLESETDDYTKNSLN